MSKSLLYLSITIATICTVTCTKIQEKSTTEAETTEAAPVDSISLPDYKTLKDSISKTIDEDIDLLGVMMMCNESFRIEMSYLISLNESGSFPDETDKTPKCYLRCVLENLHVASIEDGEIDPARAALVFAGERNGEPDEDIQEIATSCAERDKKCRCEMAYNFLKCLFSMKIEKYSKSKP